MAASALKIALTNPSPDAAAPCRYPAGTIRISALSNTTKAHPLSFSQSSTNYEATRLRPARAFGTNRVSGSADPAFDVVIVGAGIIGLTIARQFLLGSNLSVAVVDAAVPCTGATGAGTHSLN